MLCLRPPVLVLVLVLALQHGKVVVARASRNTDWGSLAPNSYSGPFHGIRGCSQAT
jgi:hypothetical protein